MFSGLDSLLILVVCILLGLCMLLFGFYYIFIIVGLLFISFFMFLIMLLSGYTFFGYLFMMVYSSGMLMLMMYVSSMLSDTEVKTKVRIPLYLSFLIFTSEVLHYYEEKCNYDGLLSFYSFNSFYMICCAFFLSLVLMMFLVLLLKKLM